MCFFPIQIRFIDMTIIMYSILIPKTYESHSSAFTEIYKAAVIFFFFHTVLSVLTRPSGGTPVSS